MVIPATLISDLQRRSRQNLREEICGIITSDLEVLPIRNVAPDRSRCFLFDRREYIEALKELRLQNKSVFCYYHSHPGNSPEPSETDCRFILKSKVSALIVTATSHKFVEYRNA